MPDETIAEFVHRSLSPLGNAAKGADMAAYMRTVQPFYGVQKPGREPTFREMCERYPPRNAGEYRARVLTLWDAGVHGPGDGWKPPKRRTTGWQPTAKKDTEMSPPALEGPRELMYAACHYAGSFPEHLTTAHLPLYKRLIVEGGWWDIVDWVSGSMVGAVVRTQRAAATPVIRRWLEDENLWLRRTAVICQIGHNEETDEAMLFRFCLERADEEDFFMRKAIGWALRHHARTNPEGVKKFLKANKKKLSALSVREAGKHIGVSP